MVFSSNLAEHKFVHKLVDNIMKFTFISHDGLILCELFSFLPGLGHYKCTGTPSLVRGDIEGEKIVHLACKGDTVLAVSGNYLGSVLLILVDFPFGL